MPKIHNFRLQKTLNLWALTQRLFLNFYNLANNYSLSCAIPCDIVIQWPDNTSLLLKTWPKNCLFLWFFSFLFFLFPAERPRVCLQQALKQEWFPQILQWMCAGYLEMLSQVRAVERSVLIICSVLAGSSLVTLYWKQSMFSQFQILHVPTSTCTSKQCHPSLLSRARSST